MSTPVLTEDPVVIEKQEEAHPCQSTGKECPREATSYTLWTCACHRDYCDEHLRAMVELDKQDRIVCGKPDHPRGPVHIVTLGPL